MEIFLAIVAILFIICVLLVLHFIIGITACAPGNTYWGTVRNFITGKEQQMPEADISQFLEEMHKVLGTRTKKDIK